jgi:hypothetical protein
MKCRHCKSKIINTFLDLGFSPPSNSYLNANDLSKPEINYPLRTVFCENCWLVQTEDFVDAEKMFTSDYAYFSSISHSWLKHSENYSKIIIEKLKLTRDSFIVEIASNDGYLLKNFAKAGIPCLGIEPTKSTAEASEKIGINVIKEFFNENLAIKIKKKFGNIDLIIANNVYAHIPDINNFTKGLKILLGSKGTITIEVAYLLKLIQNNEFDTIYHEHYSYHSLHSIKTIFEFYDLKIYDVEELETHGGSIRVYACNKSDKKIVHKNVKLQLKKEIEHGLLNKNTYLSFKDNINSIKYNLMNFLVRKKLENKIVIGYGAAAKGNTLINYCGIKKDLIPFVCDAAPSKYGNYLPGSQIPIIQPEKIKTIKPDFILILPWNIKNEIIKQLDYVKEWGCEFLIPIPSLKILKPIK